MNEEVIFMVCNIPKLLEKQMNQIKESTASNMNEDNLEGYQYAMDTVLSILKQTIHAAEIDGEIFVHSEKLNDEHELEEYDLHDFLAFCGCRITVQDNQTVI